MPDSTTIPINVTTTVTIDGTVCPNPPVELTVGWCVRGHHPVKPEVMTAVDLMPSGVMQPIFLFVRAVAVGPNDDPVKDPLPKDALFYTTFKDAPPPSQANGQQYWKPLDAGHVFIMGAAEWVTDLVDGGRPGPLRSLYFWNSGEDVVPVLGKDGKSKTIDTPLPEGAAQKDGMWFDAEGRMLTVTKGADGKQDVLADKAGKPIPKVVKEPGRITVQVIAGYDQKPKDEPGYGKPNRQP